MSETLGSVSPGLTAALITRFIGNGVVNAGATGNILMLTPPNGQRVRITNLCTDALAAGGSGNIIISIGGVDITSAIEINGAEPDLGMSVGAYHDYAAGNPPNKNFKTITGDTDEEIVIRMSSGSLTRKIYYGYIFGV